MLRPPEMIPAKAMVAGLFHFAAKTEDLTASVAFSTRILASVLCRGPDPSLFSDTGVAPQGFPPRTRPLVVQSPGSMESARGMLAAVGLQRGAGLRQLAVSSSR